MTSDRGPSSPAWQFSNRHWNKPKQERHLPYKSNKKSILRQVIEVDVKKYPTIHPDSLLRPFHGLGCSCMPHSSKGLVTPVTAKLGLRNLLKVPTSNINNYFITRQCSYIFYCARIKVSCSYPKITNKAVVEDERVKEAVERTVSEELQDDGIEAESSGRIYLALVAKYKRQAIVTLRNMKSALSSTLIRLTGYVLFKVFNFLFMSVTVTEGQLQMIESASTRNVPLIFVPLHRSHVDYLFVTWVLFNREIPAPIVAAGDNLRMPIFGWLLRGLGGFFIKRKLETVKSRKDYVYRAVLQTYMSRALHAGYNLEFFIEGGRTRTGKPCVPKGGLLSVIVDAFLSGTLDDALIVPIAINYDRIVDGNFIREQMGQKKVPESFWRAVTAIAKVLSTSYGHSRIDFGQPFSLKEFFHSSKLFPPTKRVVDESLILPGDVSNSNASFHSHSSGHSRSYSTPSNTFSSNAALMNGVDGQLHPNWGNSGQLHPTWSNSSLFGSEVTEEYRQLVKTLGSHIVYGAEKCQAIMSTNAVAYLLSFLHREGTSLERLVSSVTELQENLRSKRRDTGFSGEHLDVTVHAVRMLGPALVRVEGDLDNDSPDAVFIRPITELPNVIELNYYASALSPVYALDAIVATSLITMADYDLWSYRDVSTNCVISQSKLTDRCKRLCKILQNEFLLAPPCGDLEAKIFDVIHNLVVSGLLVCETTNQPKRVYQNYDDIDDDSSDSTCNEDTFYTLSPTSSNLDSVAMVTKGLSPLIESYYVTMIHLNTLIGRPIADQDFVRDVQRLITSMLQKGALLYGESVSADPARNALKLLQSNGVLESYSQDSLRIIFLAKEYESEEQLWPLQEEIGSFRI